MIAASPPATRPPSANGRRLGVLYVAFHFPPISQAGTHRTLRFVRALVERGHRVAVLTTSRFFDQTVDPALLDRVPSGVRVARAPRFDPFRALAAVRRSGPSAARGTMVDPLAPARAAPPTGLRRFLDWTSRLLALPDRHWSFSLLGVPFGIPAGRSVGPDVVVATSPPHSAQLLGLALSRVLGAPLVADLRDPWTLNPFHEHPYRTLRAWDETLERAVMDHAAFVVLNTERAARGYLDRGFDPNKVVAVPNGVDEDRGVVEPRPPASGPPFTLLHVGAIYGRRFPIRLVEAVGRLVERDPSWRARIRIRQVGPGPEGERLRALVRERRLDDVFAVEGPVPHEQAQALLERADWLLLLGPSGDASEVQVPSKLFEYLLTGKPILALSQPDGAIADVLAATHPPCVRADPNDPEDIARALERLAAGRLDLPGPADVTEFSPSRLADRFEQLLLRAAREAGRA